MEYQRNGSEITKEYFENKTHEATALSELFEFAQGFYEAGFSDVKCPAIDKEFAVFDHHAPSVTAHREHEKKLGHEITEKVDIFYMDGSDGSWRVRHVFDATTIEVGKLDDALEDPVITVGYDYTIEFRIGDDNSGELARLLGVASQDILDSLLLVVKLRIEKTKQHDQPIQKPKAMPKKKAKLR